MSFRSNLQEILEVALEPFDIVQEFTNLTPRRKIMLCDHLFIEGRHTFNGTVEMLWPEADENDAKKLEKHLTTMKVRAH